MGSEDIIVGLEIGTSKVCAVVGETRRDGSVRILGVGQALSRGVRKGEIVDFDTAGKCIREALADAEEKSDVMIRSVCLAVTGGHIQSVNHRGAVDIPEDREEICEEDFEDVQFAAREVDIPAANVFLHSILQHYYVDGQDGVLNPMGMMGRKLEADFHIIHGIGTRTLNGKRCVKELDMLVDEVVFAPVAAAHLVLDHNQRSLGALMIDIGAGTSGYVVYIDGAIAQSGCLPIGGDHITNDISLGLRIPMARAERLKVEEGSVILGECSPGEAVVLKDETGFAGREIEREMLNKIINCRLCETFEMIKLNLEKANVLHFLGAGLLLTGGTSMTKGIDRLAEEVFGMPVHLTHNPHNKGIMPPFENPQFSTAIGLIKYVQTLQGERPGGWFSGLWSWFSRFRRKIGLLALC